MNIQVYDTMNKVYYEFDSESRSIVLHHFENQETVVLPYGSLLSLFKLKVAQDDAESKKSI